MTDLIRTLCERLAQGLDRDPQRLAEQLGIAHAPPEAGRPITVTPSNQRFKEATVFATGGVTSMVDLVPATELTLGTLESVLGTYEPSPRLHPYDPRKFVFSPARDGSHPNMVHVVAYVSVDKPIDAAAPVQELTIICSPAFTKDDRTPSPVPEPPPVAIWPRLVGDHARFEIRAWRTYSLTTLEDVKRELEKVLGIQLVSRGTEYACALPACELRLSASPSENPQLQIFDLVGAPADKRDGEDISATLAAHLRGADCDWYVPSTIEKTNVLDEQLLDPDVLVSLVAPRWLAWAEGEDRDDALGLLQAVAGLWVSAARTTLDPVADVKRRKAEFQGWGRYFPRARTKMLFAYAIQAQMAVIEEQIFELTLLSPAERAAQPNLAAQLEEWRHGVLDLDDAVKDTGNPEIRSQQKELLASIDEMSLELKGLRTPPAVWPRLLGAAAKFSLSSLRRATLDEVRAEIEKALGIQLEPFDELMYDGPPGLRCVMRACDVGLTFEPSGQPGLTVFALVGVSGDDDPEDISDELAKHLHSANREWVVDNTETRGRP